MLLPIVLGAASYVFTTVYEMINLHRAKRPDRADGLRPLAHICFIAGIILIFASTSWVIFTVDIKIVFERSPLLKILEFAAAAGFFILFLCALFVSLPVKKTYITMRDQEVADTGLYALCRHPGTLFLMLFYLFCGLALDSGMMLWVGLSNSAFNIITTVLQDIWVFPTTIGRYNEYKKTTPFLVPTWKSVVSMTKTRDNH